MSIQNQIRVLMGVYKRKNPQKRLDFHFVFMEGRARFELAAEIMKPADGDELS
ncbi:MAG: hypothetical protein ACKVPZ_03425 [Burkholderiaceae bacterium]|jgi:hypothetical protein